MAKNIVTLMAMILFTGSPCRVLSDQWIPWRSFLICLFLVIPGLRTEVLAQTSAYFTAGEISRDNIGDFHKWAWMLSRHEENQRSPKPACVNVNDSGCKLKRAWDFLDSIAQLPAGEQLTSVNQFFNQITYVPEQGDYWETLEEFITYGGDCEDFAIAKYFALRRLGWKPDQLRVVIAQDLKLNAAHAFTVVLLNNQVMLLDNQIPQVVLANSVNSYRPYYSINEQHWWLPPRDFRASK